MSSGRPQLEHYGIPKLNWESDHEWRCRTVFLDVNKQHYKGDRLAAYSMSWANWKFMGNRYNSEVQAILEECHNRLPNELDQEIKHLREAARPKVNFVKSSENLGGKTSHTPGGKKAGGISTKNPSNFVDLTEEDSDSSSPLPSPSTDFNPHDQLTQSEFSELLKAEPEPEPEPEPESEPEELIPGLTLYFPDRGDIDWKLGVCIINESCQRCNIFIEFFFDGTEEISKGEYKYFCILNIKTIEIAKGSGTSKKEAKNDAAKRGILKLMDTQPIIYKSDINHDHLKTVQKGHLVRHSYETAPKLDDTNLGNRLLRKMGWKGTGGIGKNESGRAEPVFLNAADGRKGVGHELKDRAIKRASVEQTLLEFLQNDEQPEIRFSHDLCPEERAIIHTKCQRFGLKHKSHGKGVDRYLVVSKKVT